MDNTLNARTKTVQICSCIAIYLIAVLFAVLSVASIWQTCHIDQTNPYSEIINFDDDLVLTNIALIGLTVLGALVALRKNISIGKVNTRFIVGVMLLMSTILSLVWINLVKSSSGSDTMTILLNTARDAAQDQYQNFHSSWDYYGNYSYFLYYPFQLGYVFFAEILYRIFGTGSSDIIFQVPNVIALDFIYVGLVMITKKLFDRRSVTNITAIALTLCFQPMFMTTITYSLLLGPAFSVWSVYFVIRYMKENKIKYAVFSVLLMAVSVLLKYNNMIVMAAVCIALVLHVIGKKRFLALAVIAAMIISCIGLQKLVIFSYSARSGVELNTQVSMKMLAYTGISESTMAPGWYNGKDMETLRDSGMDVEKANEVASKGIKERFDTLSNTNSLAEFFKKKLFSQYNEPSFESVWISQVRNHDYPEGEKLPAFVESVYTGGMSKVLGIWFHYFTMMTYICFTAGMVWLIIRKKLNTESLILPVAILGGVLYYLIFEGKSQYILPYFILLIPFAVYGFVESMSALRKKSSVLFE